MSVASIVQESNTVLLVIVKDRFDYSVQKEFRAVAKGIKGKYKKLIVDLSQATYIDSAALGMLLVLREEAGKTTSIELRQPRKEVKEILKIANYDKLFTVL